MTEQQTTTKDGHLVVYLAWPILAGIALGTVLAVSVGGIVLIASGDLQAAGTVAGYVFFAVLGVATLAMVWYVFQEWAGPRQRERTAEMGYWEPEPYDDHEPPAAMVLRGFKGKPKMLPATVDLAVEAVGPVADPEIERLYRFIVDAWRADDVSQAGCMSRQWRRKDWDQYIGGSRRRADLGKESARGLLARAGIVAKSGNRWVICAALDAALSINDDLLAYASERASTVRVPCVPPVKPDKTSQDRHGVLSDLTRGRGIGGRGV